MNMTLPNRSKYLEYLPAIFQQHSYLGEFLLPFEEILTGYERLLSDVDRFWTPLEPDPASLSIDADYLPWLAGWVALVLDEEWEEKKKRELISEAVQLYQQRGTLPGLKRYLEIYTGLMPDIRECLWPSGFQIGVASQVGGFIPDLPTDQIFPMTVAGITRNDPILYHDYYVVYEEFTQFYYRADRVEKIVFSPNDPLGKKDVTIWYFPPGSSQAVSRDHTAVTITRRDHLIEDVHTLRFNFPVNTAESMEYEMDYHGDTFLLGEEEQPYRFIVDVRIPSTVNDMIKLEKVRAIIDLEKPAYTQYYLKLTLVTVDEQFLPMQIEVRSTVGVDTYVG